MNDEKTIYDDEKTQYQSHDEEATQYDDAYEKEDNKNEGTELSVEKKAENKKTQPTWQKVAVGTGSGILLGAAATLFSSSAPIDHTEGGEEEEEETHPDWTDGEVPIATSVSDEMSFSEAFAAARTEVGSGGVFEWHGNIYSTFTEEEWNGMTAEQREEYGSHFSWNNNATHDTASTPHSSDSSHEVPVTEEVEVVADNDINEQASQIYDSNNSDVEVAGVTPTENTAEDVAVVDVEPDVEVLGVVHDDESGANIGGLVVDGQEVVLIDVDGDSTFDWMGADVNGDQQLSQNEIVNISSQNFTINDLGGISNPDGSMYASNDNEIDYTNDSAEYDA